MKQVILSYNLNKKDRRVYVLYALKLYILICQILQDTVKRYSYFLKIEIVIIQIGYKLMK